MLLTRIGPSIDADSLSRGSGNSGELALETADLTSAYNKVDGNTAAGSHVIHVAVTFESASHASVFSVIWGHSVRLIHSMLIRIFQPNSITRHYVY